SYFFFFQAEDGIRASSVTGVQTCALPISQPLCQRVPGGGIDEAIGELLVEAVSPVALEVALTVQQELQSRLEEADRLRQKQVERSEERRVGKERRARWAM